jgi:predicted deacylase
MTKNLVVCGTRFFPGDRKIVQVDVGKLYDFTEMNIPVEVVCGAKDGPVLFLSGALHGDEINGVEIIRRVLRRLSTKKMKGTVLAVPVVNVFGFNTRSRYLPDRRDLNRSFPGNARGSLAAQMAKKFMKEIVKKSTHGIDFHTGAIHRFNIPQIRASTDDPRTKAMAKAFNPPVIINSSLRDGSLREAARKAKIPTLLFEGGEALRFDETVIRSGVKGTFAVMRHLGMLEPQARPTGSHDSVLVKDSFWVRAPSGGSMRVLKRAGEAVEKDEVIALILDLFGKVKIEVLAPEKGIIIGQNRLPLVNKGDALFHVATSRVHHQGVREIVDFV